MSPTSRRELLAGALAVAVAAGLPTVSGCGSSDPAVHPALRPLRPHGVVALLAADGDPTAALDLLRRRVADDVMVGLGAGCFDRAAGLAGRRPPGLGRMPPFPGEVLMPERTSADLLVQVEGGTAAAVGRRADALLAGLPGVRITWRTAVSRAVAGVDHGRPLQHNPFGFVEGHANPATADAAGQVLLPTGGEPWTAGASFLALRVIQLAHQAWDADSVDKQQRVIGRRTDGSWLDGTAAFDEPSFATDPDGALTPLDSHVRRVNPRTPSEPSPRMLRRSWTYAAPAPDSSAAGSTNAGSAATDQGMVFMAFQNDLSAGFELAQRRLTNEALAPYLLTVGAGYFLVPTPTGLTTLLT